MQPFQPGSFQGRLRRAFQAQAVFLSKATEDERICVLLAYCAFCKPAKA